MKEKEKSWKALDTRQKLEYFKDYYLFRTICILAVILIAIYLCSKVFNKEETILYVACIDNVLEEDEAKALEKKLEENLCNGKKNASVVIDDSFNTTADGISKLEVCLSSRRVDLIVADEDTYKTLAAYGFMGNLNDVVGADTVKTNEKKIIFAAGYKDNDDISFDDKETAKGEIMPYGIRIQENTMYSNLRGKLKNSVIGCTSNTKKEENAKKILETFIKDSEK